MPLLPRSTARRYADGGVMGYVSQLGNGLQNAASKVGSFIGNGLTSAGDALYQNLPPLAVPFVEVKSADLDGVKADAMAQADEQAAKLKAEVAKLRDQALKDAKMTAAGKAKVAHNYDEFMTHINDEVRKNPMYFNSATNRVAFQQRFEKALDPAFITSNVNGMAGSTKLLADLGNERQAYGAYTPNGKRLNKSYSDVIRDYQENQQASVDPLNLTIKDGTEKDALAAVDKLFTTPTSTFGGENASVGVGQIQGSQGERYTVANSHGSTTTTNAPHVNALRAAMIGYTDKKGKYHAGDWKSVLGKNEIYGLEEPRLTEYDNAPLQTGEQVTIELRGPNGAVQVMQVAGGNSAGPLAGRSRRELLQYLESNPTAANQKALSQLEQNRAHLADRDVKNLLATRLGLKLINGTVQKESVSAGRIAPGKDPAAAKDPGTTLFAAAGGQSPALPTAAMHSYDVLGEDGKPQTYTDDKGKKIPVKINPAVSIISGAEGTNEWLQRFITQEAYTTDNGRRIATTAPKGLDRISDQEAIYHLIPDVGLRQIHGGGVLGKLPNAASYRMIGQDGTLTWLASDPTKGIAGRQQELSKVKAANDALTAQRNAGQIDEPTFQSRLDALRVAAHSVGIMPYVRTTVATSENVLKDSTQPANTKNEDKHISRFGYMDPYTGKPVRPDQFVHAGFNNMRKLKELGWEEMSDAEAKNAGVSDLNEKGNNGLFGTMFKTTMYVPATNISFNSSSKVVNQNVTNVEAEKRQQAEEEVVSSGATGLWHP